MPVKNHLPVSFAARDLQINVIFRGTCVVIQERNHFPVKYATPLSWTNAHSRYISSFILERNHTNVKFAIRYSETQVLLIGTTPFTLESFLVKFAARFFQKKGHLKPTSSYILKRYHLAVKYATRDLDREEICKDTKSVIQKRKY